MRFHFPIDGDMLNAHDGAVRDGRLYVPVKIVAHPQSNIFINRVQARFDGTFFTAEVTLDSYRNTLAAYDAATSEKSIVAAYWLKDAVQKYRLSLDDNIRCMRDLVRNANDYASVFDNPYLGLYKKAHDLYGTKVHVNLYYQCDGFDLTMMPDKFKPEFQANADWLRFTFHALQNDPDRPYIRVSYDEILRDYDLVTDQIVRFAGEECLSPVTTVHWGECTREGVRALRARGVRCLMAYFQQEGNRPVVSYYCDLGQSLHLSRRNFWKDHAEDMIFGRTNLVLNIGTAGDIRKNLEREKSNPHTAGFMELMIHEQYFYPDYAGYLPDYENRVLDAVLWATESGYKPAWVKDCVWEP